MLHIRRQAIYVWNVRVNGRISFLLNYTWGWRCFADLAECSTSQIYPSHANSLAPFFFPTVFKLVIPLSLCLIPFFSQYHLNDSCKPLRIFSCKWWGFFLKGEKKEIHSVGTFTSFPILPFLFFPFLTHSHPLSPLSLCSLIAITNMREDLSEAVKAQVSGYIQTLVIICCK